MGGAKYDGSGDNGGLGDVRERRDVRTTVADVGATTDQEMNKVSRVKRTKAAAPAEGGGGGDGGGAAAAAAAEAAAAQEQRSSSRRRRRRVEE